MTRIHNQEIHCPECGAEITTATSFARWVRDNKELDSVGKGLSVMDADWIFHRFRTEMGRDFQCVMIVEVKTRNGQMPAAQLDTGFLIDQLMRNRRQTPTHTPSLQAGNSLTRIYSAFQKKWVYVRAFGFHRLTFDNLGPSDSQLIKWDKIEITQDQLTKLLCFDLDPDSLRPMDWRSHHARNGHSQGITLFGGIGE